MRNQKDNPPYLPQGPPGNPPYLPCDFQETFLTYQGEPRPGYPPYHPRRTPVTSLSA